MVSISAGVDEIDCCDSSSVRDKRHEFDAAVGRGGRDVEEQEEQRQGGRAVNVAGNSDRDAVGQSGDSGGLLSSFS